MSEVDKLSPGYWDQHSITDGCMPVGYRPSDWRRLLKNYPEQLAIAKNFTTNRPKGGKVLTSGLVDPSHYELGTILEIEEEYLAAGRNVNNIHDKLFWVLTLGLKNTNFDWEKPRYNKDIDICIVTDLERHREKPIRGLISFDEKLLRRGMKLYPRHPMPTSAIPKTDLIQIGQVEHNKFFDRLQANDHQTIQRTLKVTVHE